MSIVELMIKQSIGKIDIEFDCLEMAQEMELGVLSFLGTDANGSGKASASPQRSF